MTVEEFSKALVKTLSNHPDSRGGYILTGNLISALQLAMVPAGEQGHEFPRMLYRREPGGGTRKLKS